jgi:hypothetical protein
MPVSAPVPGGGGGLGTGGDRVNEGEHSRVLIDVGTPS